MSDLDSKLREILNTHVLHEGGRRGLNAHETIAQIKQAFADEGWAPFTEDGKVKVQELIRSRNLMTGREWYGRFGREYHMRADWISSDESMGADAEHDVLLAAKLAAGIE